MSISNESIMGPAMNQIFDNEKSTVSLFRATKTESNITGSAEINYADEESIDIIIYRVNTSHEWLREGLYENVDAILFDKPDNNNLSKDDKIISEGRAYIIQAVNPWNSRGTGIYEEMTAKLIE